MVEIRTISGWAICVPDTGTYFLKREDGCTTWTNSYTESKKFESREEAQKYLEYLKSLNLNFGVEKCIVRYISYTGYY